MTVYQNQNQITQGPDKGDVSAIPSPNTISCQITTASANTFYAGTAVVLIAGTANTILVEKAAATSQIFGFVIRNPKKPSHTAGGKVEIAMPGTVMNMESASAVNRGQLVEYVATNDLIQAYAGVNTAIGVALDTATAANQLIRVLIRTVIDYSSSSSSSSCRSSSSSSSSSAT
jgi:hypothetical protein